MHTQEVKKNKYEMAYLIMPEIKEGESENWKEKLSSLIATEGGEVKSNIDPKKQKLAYPIKHYRHGYFGVINFTFPTEKILNLSNAVKLEKDILRHMIIKDESERTTPKKARISAPKDGGGTTAPPASAKKEPEKPKKDGAIDIKEIDKKLDEILKGEI